MVETMNSTAAPAWPGSAAVVGAGTTSLGLVKSLATAELRRADREWLLGKRDRHYAALAALLSALPPIPRSPRGRPWGHAATAAVGAVGH